MGLVEALVSLPVQLLNNVPVRRNLGFRFEIVGDLLLAEDSGKNFPCPIIVFVLARLHYAGIELFGVGDWILKNYLRRDFIICEEVHQEERILTRNIEYDHFHFGLMNEQSAKYVRKKIRLSGACEGEYSEVVSDHGFEV